jgi:two-component system cell cycle response regulator
MSVRLRVQPLPGRVVRDREAGLPPAPPFRVLLVGPPREVARVRERLHRPGIALASGVEVRLEDAWRALGYGGVDVAVVVLTASDADALLAFTRLQSATPEVPFVVVVDAAREADGLEALRCGAQEYVLRERLDSRGLARALRCAVERHRHLALLREMSFTDPLTRLHNRRGFLALAEAQLQLVHRSRRDATLLYVDVDGLKVINDVYGHAEGDRALVRVAQALRGTLRRSDLVARMGGDEFVALLFDTDAGATAATLRRIQEALARDESTVPRRPVTVSTGHARLDPAAVPDLGNLLARADQDLYRRRTRRAARAPANATGRPEGRPVSRAR